MKMNKKIILGVVLVGIVLVIAVAALTSLNSKQQTNSTSILINATKCGDGICEADEGCNTCEKDCGCVKGEYCDNSSGTCKKEVCGNGICTENKKTNCCQDCGCYGSEICNKFTGKCIAPAEIKETDINKIIEEYLKKNNINATVVKIKDAYYKNISVKEASLDCSKPKEPFPCNIMLVIDENGNILEEFHTT